MRRLDETDMAFIKETYPAFTKREVCAKLSINGRQYSKTLADLGLSEMGITGLHCPRIDWPSLWYAYIMRGSIADAAEAVCAEYNAARYAIDKMRNMSERRRLDYWNRYAHKHGREEYSVGDLSVIV